MAPIYQHTQIGTATIVILVLVFAVVAFTVRAKMALPFYVIVLSLIALAGVLFSTMTVTVDERDLRWHFTFGFWSQQIALTSIASVEPVTNKWWWGLGIRATPQGRLYNVSGLAAVAVTETNGHRVRIGTDQPEALAAAIRGAIGQ